MRMPTFYLSHGGGPWPWMKGPMHGAHARLSAALRTVPKLWPERPRALLVVTAHWEAPRFEFCAQAAPGMLHDYDNFPPETYQVLYPAPGEPELARRAHDLLAAAGLPHGLEHERGYDHGTFVPLFVIEPGAALPVVQMSLHEAFDPELHLRAGAALQPLRDEGVVIIGSGSSFHNMRAQPARIPADSAAFDAWLNDVSVGQAGRERAELQGAWTQAPSARAAHQREEHLLPLMVAVGAAGDDPGRCIYRQTDFLGAGTVSSYAFGAPTRAADPRP